MGVVQEDRKSKMPIRDIKYSPEGDLLAVASEDGKIYLHETKKNYNVRGTCTLKDVVSHMDFSVDGNTIQCTSEDKEFQYGK
jgi:WD40 repeat protein